jgi:class 3 adenylate cyclase
VNVPETRYARTGDTNLAYQVLGRGPVDLVLVPGFVSNLEYGWELPEMARFYERLSSFSRLVLFDKRGTGLSDRVGGIATLETRMDDVRTVMDATGLERAAVMGVSEGGPMTLLLAATYPQRIAAAVVYGSTPAAAISTPDFPWGASIEVWDEFLGSVEQTWGTPETAAALLQQFAPSRTTDREFSRWWESFLRLGASPGASKSLGLMNREIDIRHALSAVSVPTLILHRRDDAAIPVGASRYLAEHIPSARYVELQGVDHLPWVDPDPVVDAVRDFLREVWSERPWEEVEPERVLATVLFTDIVGSTAKATALGDRRWRELVAKHHAIVRHLLIRYRGREVDTAGDGFFATFDGPARAIRCACAIAREIGELGMEVRAGLHTGECELMDDKVGGFAVHVGARVLSEAEPDEVLVSSTLKDLVAGSGIQFDERGERELKGIPGTWRLFAVAGDTGR